MVEAILSARISAPTAPNNSLRPRETARGHGIEVRTNAEPPREVQALQASVLVLPVLAPDVLIVAQQARDTTPPQTEDERPSLASDFTQQDDENISNAADESSQALAPDGGAEIIPLYGSDAFSSLLSSAAQPATAGPRPVLAPDQPTDQAADFAHANQAYVTAGAADGRTFGSAVFETVTPSTNQSPVNILA